MKSKFILVVFQNLYTHMACGMKALSMAGGERITTQLMKVQFTTPLQLAHACILIQMIKQHGVQGPLSTPIRILVTHRLLRFRIQILQVQQARHLKTIFGWYPRIMSGPIPWTHVTAGRLVKTNLLYIQAMEYSDLLSGTAMPGIHLSVPAQCLILFNFPTATKLHFYLSELS